MKKLVALVIVSVLALACVATLAVGDTPIEDKQEAWNPEIGWETTGEMYNDDPVMPPAYDAKTMQIYLNLSPVFEWSIPETLELYEDPEEMGQNVFGIEVTKFNHFGERALLVFFPSEVVLKGDTDVTVTLTPEEDELNMIIEEEKEWLIVFPGVETRAVQCEFLSDISNLEAGIYSNEVMFEAMPALIMTQETTDETYTWPE